MTVKKVTIVRLEQSDAGALGSLLIDNWLYCSSLEPDVNDTDRFQIPVGKYLCKRFYGYKWKKTFEVVVKGHTAILFHAGNVEADTEGCILLGRQPSYLKGQRAILNSGFTYRKFLKEFGTIDEFMLTIYDFCPFLKNESLFYFRSTDMPEFRPNEKPGF